MQREGQPVHMHVALKDRRGARLAWQRRSGRCGSRMATWGPWSGGGAKATTDDRKRKEPKDVEHRGGRGRGEEAAEMVVTLRPTSARMAPP